MIIGKLSASSEEVKKLITKISKDSRLVGAIRMAPRKTLAPYKLTRAEEDKVIAYVRR